MPQPRRGRPAKADRDPLDRPTIARTALRIAGEHGFPALTMRRLAEELDVTPRALYNVIADRQDAVDLAIGELSEATPQLVYDTDHWEGSLRDWYVKMRTFYRRFPRALLVSLDEKPSAATIPIDRLLSSEASLRFFTSLGLPLADAMSMRNLMLLDAFALALLIDYRYDRTPLDMHRHIGAPVPQPWLDAHPDVELPLAHQAAELAADVTADSIFDDVVERMIGAVRERIGRG